MVTIETAYVEEVRAAAEAAARLTRDLEWIAGAAVPPRAALREAVVLCAELAATLRTMRDCLPPRQGGGAE